MTRPRDASVLASGYHGVVQLAFTTVDDFFALLEAAGEAVDYREAWPHLFPVENCPPDLMHTLVDDIVRSDERFAWESDVHVGLSAWQARRHDIAGVSFTVVDLETTGATPGFAKITEIGAVRIEDGREVATFSELVNPGLPIPAMIVGITGIDDALVADAAPIEAVLPRFVEFSADSILVAHNAPFDLSFLDYELTRLHDRTFSRPALDTLRLARKLCPQQRRSLAALSERFDTRVKPRHRALQDAQATSELLLMFLARLEEQGIATIEEVARFCAPQARRNYHKIALTEGLPVTPGVYVMRDEHEAALYIGKAENLRRRTRDHFIQQQAHRARQALELLTRIEVHETGSEFGALVLEGRLIAKHKPTYNTHGIYSGSYHYVKLTTDEYPRVYATPNLRADGASYAGPFRKASLARRFAQCLTSAYQLRVCSRLPAGKRSCARAGTACLAACRGDSAAYADAAAAARRVIEGDPAALDALLAERQAEQVAGLAFERAAQIHNQRETVRRATRTVRRLQAALKGDAVLVYPARRAGWISLWGVRGGRLALEREYGRHVFSAEVAAAFLSELERAAPAALPLPADELDEILLVQSWLDDHWAAVNVVDLRPLAAAGQPFAAVATDLVAQAELCAGEHDGNG